MSSLDHSQLALAVTPRARSLSGEELFLPPWPPDLAPSTPGASTKNYSLGRGGSGTACNNVPNNYCALKGIMHIQTCISLSEQAGE